MHGFCDVFQVQKWRMESKAAAEAKATATAPEENLSSKKGKETVI